MTILFINVEPFSSAGDLAYAAPATAAAYRSGLCGNARGSNRALLPHCSHKIWPLFAVWSCAAWWRRQAPPSAGSLGRPKWPLSWGSGPSDCSSRPLVSYQIHRQLSGGICLHWWHAPSVRTVRLLLCPGGVRM